MRIMGLKDAVHWLTWFILCTAVMMLTAFFLVLFLKVMVQSNTSNVSFSLGSLVWKDHSIFQLRRAHSLLRLLHVCYHHAMFSAQHPVQSSESGSLRYLVVVECLHSMSASFLGAGILYFLLYLPYTVLINYDTQTQTWQKIIAVRRRDVHWQTCAFSFQCFSSTVAFGLGCDYIAR